MASVVQESGCGVVAAGDPANFGLAIKRLLEDRELCVEMGRAGRRVVEMKYTWPGIGQQMIDLYSQVLTSRDGSLHSV